MKHLFCWWFVVLSYGVSAQVKLASWNIQNFGRSKSDASISFIANTLREFDLVTLQEVVAGPGGAQAVARLADELNRKGSKWDYMVSDPTTGTPGSSERYAFLWKTAKIKILGKPWLDPNSQSQIDREPFMGTFAYKGKNFTVASFHAVPKSKKPQLEIRLLKLIPGQYPGSSLIFAGDFNCPQSSSAFFPLKSIGYRQALRNKKTSLKGKGKTNDCLASEYDNFWFRPDKIKALRAGTIPFYESFSDLKQARRISDHIPVALEFEPN